MRAEQGVSNGSTAGNQTVTPDNTGYSSEQIDLATLDLENVEVARVCNAMSFDWNSGTNTISNQVAVHCGADSNEPLEWYPVYHESQNSFSSYAELDWNGSEYNTAEYLVGTFASFSWPLEGPGHDWGSGVGTCQIDYQPMEIVGKSDGTIEDNTLVVEWSPSGDNSTCYDMGLHQEYLP